MVATVINQLIENDVAPQLIGGFTGLNPIWILISLLIGAKLAGLLGLVIVVPITGSVKDMLELILINLRYNLINLRYKMTDAAMNEENPY